MVVVFFKMGVKPVANEMRWSAKEVGSR